MSAEENFANSAADKGELEIGEGAHVFGLPYDHLHCLNLDVGDFHFHAPLTKK